MKVRDSGMPGKHMWETFFDPYEILGKMQLDESISVAVDFGCGYGTFSIPAARIVRTRVIGFDIEPEMIEGANILAESAGLENLELVLRDFIAKGTGLANDSVDYVMLFNIMHAENPHLLLKEVYRILRPGGRVGIIHWNYDANTPRGPKMEIRPKPGQCKLWSKSAGFNVIDAQIELPPYHYGLVVVK